MVNNIGYDMVGMSLDEAMDGMPLRFKDLPAREVPSELPDLVSTSDDPKNQNSHVIIPEPILSPEMARLIQLKRDQISGQIKSELGDIPSADTPTIVSDKSEIIRKSSKEKIRPWIAYALVAAIGILAIAELTPAHPITSVLHRLNYLIDYLKHPPAQLTADVSVDITSTPTLTPTSSPPPTLEYSATPSIETIRPTYTATTGEGDSPPKPPNEFIKYIEPGNFDNDSQRAMHTDLFIRGGNDGTSTYIIQMPNENASNTLENPVNPQDLMRFNPEKNRWERLSLPQSNPIQSITYINNPGKNPDGFLITWDGGSTILSGSKWEPFDPSEPKKNPTILENWATTIADAIRAKLVWYSQDPVRHTPLESGPAVFHILE